MPVGGRWEFLTETRTLPVPREGVVDAIQENSGQNTQNPGDPPRAPELLQDEQRGAGLGVDRLPLGPVVGDQIESVEIARVEVVPRQGLTGKAALERGKAKGPPGVARQDEAVQPVAQPADAVVEDDVMAPHASSRSASRWRCSSHSTGGRDLFLLLHSLL